MKTEPFTFSEELSTRYARHGYWSHPLLSDVLEAHAMEAPHRLALIDDSSQQVTYGELDAAVNAAASWFSDRGLGHGDAVVIALPNSIDYALAYLSANRLGMTTVAMNARESGTDIANAAGRTEAAMLLVPAGSRADRMRQMMVEDGVPASAVVVVGERDASDAGFEGWPGWKSFVSDVSDAVRPTPAIDGRTDVDFVVFSSGTTGRPKGIAHTFAGASASVWNWIGALGLTWRDTVFAPATFGHVGGLQWGLRTAVASGAPVVIMDRWDPATAAELIGRYECRYTLVTPTYISDLVSLPDEVRSRTSGFRYWAVGGSRMSPEFVQGAAAALGGQLLRGFGMSETFMATITRPDDPLEARLNFDGRALPGCELQVRDEEGYPVPPGMPGQLYVCSPSLVNGYFTDPEETASCFGDGWFRTGDVVTIDASGYMTVTDRKKELIIRGGENISPQEVEQVLATLPGLPAFAVTGLPDARLGEVVALVYEGSADELSLDELRIRLSTTRLAKYKWPELVIAVEALPRTALGKIQRGALRRLAESVSA